MKIYLATPLTRKTSKEDLNKTMPIKHHLESYFYLKNKPGFLKYLKEKPCK